jgi:hypothetical protein
VRADLRDSIYFVGFLLAAGVLLILGRDQLPSAGLFTWGLTFGATTAAGILLVSLYRVQLELKQSRHELARKQAEMNFAREVQAALFPRDLPVDRGLSFSAICIPAQGSAVITTTFSSVPTGGSSWPWRTSAERGFPPPS